MGVYKTHTVWWVYNLVGWMLKYHNHSPHPLWTHIGQSQVGGTLPMTADVSVLTAIMLLRLSAIEPKPSESAHTVQCSYQHCSYQHCHSAMWITTLLHVTVFVCVYICVCVCMCMCGCGGGGPRRDSHTHTHTHTHPHTHTNCMWNSYHRR